MNGKISTHVVVYHGLIIEIISDQEKLLKIDFLKNNDRINCNTVITEPIQKTISILDNYFSRNNNEIKILFFRNECDVINDPEVLYLDMNNYTENEINVYTELMHVKTGETISYSSLAYKSGISRGARFAGNCMAKNRFPIIIPCHRVIKKDGSTGNYTGGIGIKELLLAYESGD